MDSRTSHLDERLIELLEEALHKDTLQVYEHNIAKITSEYSPIDLAYVVSQLPPTERPVVYKHISDEDKPIFLVNTDRNTRVAIFRYVDNQDICKLLSKMSVDDVVFVLDDLPEGRVKRVLDLLSPEQALQIREIRKHDPDTAGRLMSKEFFAFTMDTTLGEVRQFIRNHPGVDLVDKIFVLDEKGELMGCVPVRNLLINSPEITIKQIMQMVPHTVLSDASRDVIVDLFERYQLSVLPVVDENNVLIGVITHDDAIEALEDIADETVANIAGTSEDVDVYDPLWKRFLARAPWLIVTLGGGLINAMNIRYFESLFRSIVVLFFVPLVAGMSGNVGLQCSTVLVRGMATGEISHANLRRAIFKEIEVGLTNGVFFSFVGGTLVFLVNYFGIYSFGTNPIEIGMIVAAGLMSSCLTATTLGVTFPLLFARLGVDPAVAAGPIITAFNDVCSTIIYFVIVQFIGKCFFA